ncbi:MAG: gluconate kinase [Dehalococcoidia bacterium]|nr:gluconate kinase [Dehalococcoidia bacterium]
MLFLEGEKVLGRGESVILDASFKKAAERQKAGEIARKKGAEFLVVECRLADERLLKERLEGRARAGSVSDGRWELLEEQKRDFDMISGLPELSHIVVETTQPVEQVVDRILAKLGIETNPS